MAESSRYNYSRGKRTPKRQVQKRYGVIYLRVSSKEQELEGFSIPAQRRLLEGYVAKEGIQILEVFEDVDTAKLGETRLRPELTTSPSPL